MRKKRRRPIRTGSRTPKRKCEHCGRVVLATRYADHVESLCIVKCNCGLIVRGRFFQDHQDTAIHRTRIGANRDRQKHEVSTFAGAKPIEPAKLSWRLLPPGEHPFSEIVRHYRGLQERNIHVEYEIERLNRVYHLHPSSTFIGLDEFEGYIVFDFQNSQIAALECPIVGNAIYIIKGKWRPLSRLSKAELLRRQNVVRIVHSGNWVAKLEALLRRW
jgi:hypothetical protein